MKCKHCGREIDDGATYCPFCGVNQSDAQTENGAVSEIDELNQNEKKLRRLSKFANPLSIVLIIFAGIAYFLLGLPVLAGILALPVVVGNVYLRYKKRKLYQQKDSFKLNNTVGRTKKSDELPYEESMNLNGTEKVIKNYLTSNMLWTVIWSVTSLLFVLLLFFVPFFSIIIKEVSIFELIKANELFEVLFDASQDSGYRDLLTDILQDCKLYNVVGGADGFEIYFIISVFLVVFLALGAPFYSCGVYVYRWVKFNNDDNYKNAIIYRYERQLSEKEERARGMGVIGIIITLALSLPTLDFLITLTEYFKDLTNSFYFICLIFLFVIIFCCADNRADTERWKEKACRCICLCKG